MALSRASDRAHLDPADAFDLGEAFQRGSLRLRSRVLLPEPFELARGEVRPSEPIVFVRDEGRTARDLIGTSYATIRLVSERFLEVLREHGFTGWATFPVKIWLGDDRVVEGYEGFAVTGRCGPIDDELSESIELAPPVPGGRSTPGLRGMCFSPDSWDGSEVFTPDDRASIFVIEPVRRALEQACMTGLEFRRLTEIERPVY